MKPLKTSPQTRHRWMRWYRAKSVLRRRNGLTAHGTPRIHKMAPGPGYARLGGIVETIALLLSDSYQYLPMDLRARSNAVCRTLSAIKRNHPRRKVKVV